MTPERWQQVKALFQSAVEVEAGQRTAFLDIACAADPSLRRHVEALIASHEKAPSFLESPKLEVLALPLIDDEAELSPGQHIGPYEVLQEIGRGGMGVVYKAKDTRLNRTVAIKVLPRHFSERAGLRQRFEREARAIASLNHPNICALYDIGREDGTDFLVMEYLEGETLSQRLKKGPLPTDQLLRTGIEIATALDQAHRHGVTHRDLKPGNIMLTKTGAKLLDFGLAKQHSVAGLDEAGPGPTAPATESLTEEGIILGTLEYMAPEQVEGKEVDSRTDIFAFGVALYEMATGRKAFAGESRASLTAAILASEPPPISRIQPITPPALDHVVKRCLAKDPEDRWQSTSDITSELKWIAEAGGAISAMTSVAETAGLKSIARMRRRELLYGALAVAFLVAAIVSAVSYLRLARAPARAIISEILSPEGTEFGIDYDSHGPAALSPDGRTLAFPAWYANGKVMLWLRSLDSPTARRLAGTEDGAQPFWSADGRMLGFFADGKLKIIQASGGPATVVADAPGNVGGSWNREGTILFIPEQTKGLYQVAASGGTPVPVLKLDPSKGECYAWPRFLPDGKHFLYQASYLDPADSGIYLASLDGKENRRLLKEGSGAIYASGYLLSLRDATVMAQAFDPEREQLKGDAHAVAEEVTQTRWGRGSFDVSENGVLIYYQGGDWRELRRMTWLDRTGKELSVSERGGYVNMRFSPDGAKLSFFAIGQNGGIWVDDLARGVRTRLATGDDYGNQVWSPDGSRILFGIFRGKRQLGIYQKNSDGTGGEEMLLPAQTSDPSVFPTSWSRDGRFILFVSGSLINPRQHLWVLPLVGDRKPRLFVEIAFDGQFSPDGRWVAYTSIESGELQVYVVPFDATKVLNKAAGSVASPGGKWQISTSGGAIARWRGDGKEIFYGWIEGGMMQMMAAEVDGTGKTFKARKAQPLFRVARWTRSTYEVTPDGKRFVIITQDPINPKLPLTLVQNWTALLGNKP